MWTIGPIQNVPRCENSKFCYTVTLSTSSHTLVLCYSPTSDGLICDTVRNIASDSRVLGQGLREVFIAQGGADETTQAFNIHVWHKQELCLCFVGVVRLQGVQLYIWNRGVTRGTGLVHGEPSFFVKHVLDGELLHCCIEVARFLLENPCHVARGPVMLCTCFHVVGVVGIHELRDDV